MKKPQLEIIKLVSSLIFLLSIALIAGCNPTASPVEAPLYQGETPTVVLGIDDTESDSLGTVQIGEPSVPAELTPTARLQDDGESLSSTITPTESNFLEKPTTISGGNIVLIAPPTGFPNNANENGVIIENSEAFFDLDKGEITTEEAADLYFWYSCGTICIGHVNVIQGAVALRLAGGSTGFSACQEALAIQEPEDLGLHMEEGKTTCIITNEGSLAMVSLVEVILNRAEALGSVEISYTVWDEQHSGNSH